MRNEAAVRINDSLMMSHNAPIFPLIKRGNVVSSSSSLPLQVGVFVVNAAAPQNASGEPNELGAFGSVRSVALRQATSTLTPAASAHVAWYSMDICRATLDWSVRFVCNVRFWVCLHSIFAMIKSLFIPREFRNVWGGVWRCGSKGKLTHRIVRGFTQTHHVLF